MLDLHSSTFFALATDFAGPVFEFYQNLNQFYGVLSECCTQQSCPAMSAGPGYVLRMALGRV